LYSANYREPQLVHIKDLVNLVI